MRTSVGMKAEYTHRLVAKAFIKNKDNKPCVNHKDGNKRNNHYSNLEWVTNKENMVHASKNNLINRDSNIRKKQAPINARKGKIKVYKKLCKYTLEGELVEVLENSLQGEPFRFSWKGYMYRSYEIFYKTYGFIPQKIAPLPKHFRYSAKKIVKQYDGNMNLLKTYIGYPKYSRDNIYKSVIYNLQDNNGYYWKIEPILNT